MLARTHPHVGVLLLSRFTDLSAAGLEGFDLPPGSRFVPKDRIVDTEALLATIDAVLAGRPGPVADDALAPLSVLTRAQLAVLRLAATGLSSGAIAQRRARFGGAQGELHQIPDHAGTGGHDARGEHPGRLTTRAVGPRRARRARPAHLRRTPAPYTLNLLQ